MTFPLFGLAIGSAKSFTEKRRKAPWIYPYLLLTSLGVVEHQAFAVMPRALARLGIYSV